MSKRMKQFVTLSVAVIVLVVAAIMIKGMMPDQPRQRKEPVSTSSAIEQAGYMQLPVSYDQIHQGDLILVNQGHPYQFPASDDNLVLHIQNKTDSYLSRDWSVKVDQRIMEPLNGLMDAFVAKTGLKTIIVTSGFRTLEEQRVLFERDQKIETDESGNEFVLVAPPGESEHHTGMAIDLTVQGQGFFDGEGKYAFVKENAAQYGFILRYTQENRPKTKVVDEPWHFRYVGQPHAEIMYGSNAMCFEDYIDTLKNYASYKKPLEFTAKDGRTYEIYFCPADENTKEITVPENHPYTVSGNNVDGFIVTVETSRNNSASGDTQSGEATSANTSAA